MKGYDFEVFDRAKVPSPGRPTGRPSRYAATLGEFLASGADCVRVDPGLLDPRIMATAFNSRVKKERLTGQVRAVARGDYVFLLRVTT